MFQRLLSGPLMNHLNVMLPYKAMKPRKAPSTFDFYYVLELSICRSKGDSGGLVLQICILKLPDF